MTENKTTDNTISYHSKLVGVTFEGRQEIIKMLSGDEPLRVRREKDNQYDENAVAVDVMIAETWQPIGYIAKDKNKDIATTLDSGNTVYIALGGITGGNDKSYGVNIKLEYVKELATNNAVSEKLTPSTLEENLSELLGQGYTLSITAIKKNTILYTSRMIGKSKEVEVDNGHIGLSGYTSGSEFPKKFYYEFEQEEMLTKISENFNVDKEAIRKMWNINREASTNYGSAIHAALENYDTYHILGDKIKSVKEFKTKPTEYGPNKALSRNPFLKKIVEDFHEKFGGDYTRLSEQFIWADEEKLCGSIDRVKVIDAEKRIIRIQDFKTDGDIHEKKYQISDSPFKSEMGNELLDLHWLQLSFYAYILINYYGYTVEGLDVYWLNPVKLCAGENAWEEFSHGVIDITKGL